MAVEDELARELRRPVRVGLAVGDEDVDLVGLAADLEAFRVGRGGADGVDDEPVPRREPGQRTGERADIADGDRSGRGRGFRTLDARAARGQDAACARGQRTRAQASQHGPPYDALLLRRPVGRFVRAHFALLRLNLVAGQAPQPPPRRRAAW